MNWLAFEIMIGLSVVQFGITSFMLFLRPEKIKGSMECSIIPFIGTISTFFIVCQTLPEVINDRCFRHISQRKLQFIDKVLSYKHYDVTCVLCKKRLESDRVYD